MSKRINVLVVYQAGVAAGSVICFVALVASGVGIGSPWPVAGLALVAALAERGRVKLSPTTESSISLLPTVFAAVVFGPIAAMVVAGASFLPDLRRPFLKWGIYTSTRSLSGAFGGLAALAVDTSSDVSGIALGTAAAALVAETLDCAFASVTLRLRGGDALESLKTTAPVAAASIPFYTPVVALLGLAYIQLSPWTLALFFAPALAAQRLFAMYQQQRELTDELVGANAQQERANLSFATALVATLDARDRYTAGHSAAVAIYARDIAGRMGLPPEEQRLAHLCGLVHDIGKIGLPPGLLEKPGALTLEERRQMERHSEIGERILAKVEDYAEIAAIVRHHHERVDGNGYPDQLIGEEIPALARIIAVADAYNAMTSDRPYRDAMPSRVARLRLAQAVETQFDTSVVAAFEAILAGAPETYRLGIGDDFHLARQEAEVEREHATHESSPVVASRALSAADVA